MRNGPPRARLGLALASGLSPALADAHLVNTGLGPVYDGIIHFGSTPEDCLPAIALAVLAGLRGKTHARRAILPLALAWLGAGIVGEALRVALPDSLAWLPLVAMGLLVAADPRLSIAATTAIAIALGALLGYGNGVAMAQAGTGLRAIFGIAATVLVSTTLVTAGAVAWQEGWMRIAWRVAGSWIAAGGLLLLGWSLR